MHGDDNGLQLPPLMAPVQVSRYILYTCITKVRRLGKLLNIFLKRTDMHAIQLRLVVNSCRLGGDQKAFKSVPGSPVGYADHGRSMLAVSHLAQLALARKGFIMRIGPVSL